MQLLELLQAVKDGTLEKEDLEMYRDKLCMMYGDLKIEAAELKKKESIHYLQTKTPEVSGITVKHLWRASEDGRRLILLEAYISASAKAIDSLKMRIYAKIT